MPKKNTVKGSRKVSKKNSKPKTSKKASKSKSSKKTKSSRKYRNVTSSSEDMRQLLSSTEERNNNGSHQQHYNQQHYNQQPMQHQPAQFYNQQPQHQVLSPSQVDPMMINSFAPYQPPNQNFMGMQSQNLMSAQQMINGLRNFAGSNESLNNNVLSPVHQQMNDTAPIQNSVGMVNTPPQMNVDMGMQQQMMSQQNMMPTQNITPTQMGPVLSQYGGGFINGLKNFI